MTDTVTVPRDVRQWNFYPVVMPITKGGEGHAVAGEIETMTWEVWDRYLQSHASFDNLPDAINECLSRNALAAAPKAEPVSGPYKLESPTPRMLSQMAFNLSGDFGPEFVRDNVDFARAIIDEFIYALKSCQPEAQNGEPVAIGYLEHAVIADLRNGFAGVTATVYGKPESGCEAIYTHPAPSSELLEAAEHLANEFAWSAVQADCDEARDELQVRINRLRSAIVKHKGPQS